jgi:hypothetical protein
LSQCSGVMPHRSPLSVVIVVVVISPRGRRPPALRQSHPNEQSPSRPAVPVSIPTRPDDAARRRTRGKKRRKDRRSCPPLSSPSPRRAVAQHEPMGQGPNPDASRAKRAPLPLLCHRRRRAPLPACRSSRRAVQQATAGPQAERPE